MKNTFPRLSGIMLQKKVQWTDSLAGTEVLQLGWKNNVRKKKTEALEYCQCQPKQYGLYSVLALGS